MIDWGVILLEKLDAYHCYGLKDKLRVSLGAHWPMFILLLNERGSVRMHEVYH